MKYTKKLLNTKLIRPKSNMDSTNIQQGLNPAPNEVSFNKDTEKIKSDASLTKSIQDNIAKIKSVMRNSSDLIVRLLKAVKKTNFTYASIYISELVNENSINNLSLSLIEIKKILT